MTACIEIYTFRQVTTQAAPDVLTPKQVAGIFNVSEVTVRAWAREGKLAYFRTPGGHRRFYRADVEALIEVVTEAAS